MSNQKKITFITGNVDKVYWTVRYLKTPLAHKKLDLTEIQSLNPREVVEHKVKEAYAILQQPVLVEDTALTFHALGKLPGPYIKWFLQELGTQGICKLLKEERSATATVTFGFHDGKKIHFCKGLLKGTIAEKPRGINGFGWDSIFIPEGQSKTYAEMPHEKLDKFSLRRIALRKLQKLLYISKSITR